MTTAAFSLPATNDLELTREPGACWGVSVTIQIRDAHDNQFLLLLAPVLSSARHDPDGPLGDDRIRDGQPLLGARVGRQGHPPRFLSDGQVRTAWE
jgi:hypothetical protein